MTFDRPLLAGVMGWPVMHSRSPLMHNHWFAALGLKGGYVPLAIPPDGLEAALRALPALGFAGCNLTIPHKQAAMDIVDEVDDTARLIGAISCVTVLPDGRLRGSNNDWIGFLGCLRDAAPDWSGTDGPAVVIGAGGGARAVTFALQQAGVPEIRLANRSPDRAMTLAADLGSPCRVVDWSDRAAALQGAAVLVNTTSLGMVGNPSLDLALDLLPASAIVVDIVYTPLETPLLRQARLRGHLTVNGLGMLLHQAVPAWQAWFGLTPVVTADLRTKMETDIRAAMPAPENQAER